MILGIHVSTVSDRSGFVMSASDFGYGNFRFIYISGVARYSFQFQWVTISFCVLSDCIYM